MICILAALKREIDSVLDMAQKTVKEKTAGRIRYLCSIRGIECCVARTGMGEKKIDPTVVRECSTVVSTGFCGALIPQLKAGDIVISRRILHADKKDLDGLFIRARSGKAPRKGDEFPWSEIAHPQWFLEAESAWEQEFSKKNIALFRGATITAARAVRTGAQKSFLGNVAGAVAVEMEDFPRMKLCAELGVPFFSVRAVLDEAEDEVPGLHSGLRMYSDVRILLDHLSVAQKSIAVFFDAFCSRFPADPNFS